ncbi:MAG: 3-hydroxyacyl-CoA dehydrogenase family protein [bacterium]|nr:3-hydroxyacyl-CoA dehydrogenase family protein [bacterium]
MTPQEIRRIGVVGGGYVGHGVAQQFAQAGYPVAMYNRTPESSERAMAGIRRGVQIFVDEGYVTPQEAEETLARIAPTTDFRAAVEGADFIVESVSEKLEVKQEIFREMDSLAPENAILASETSGLKMTDISRMTQRPERCISTHSYTPPPLIPVVEISPGERTAPEVVEATMAFLRLVGKEPVLCKEVPGHIGVRLTTAMRREAYNIIEKGYATPEAVDTVVRSVGRLWPILGILEVSDLSGIDVMRDVQRNIQPHLDHRAEPSPLLDKMIEAGTLGQKAGKGFYEWDEARRNEILGARDRMLLRWLRENPRAAAPSAS